MSQDPTPSDFTPPEIKEISDLLPSYEVTEFIAKGGMGAVYKARQISLDRDVAIKVLPRHFGADAAFRASFEAEAKSMAKFNHPNLIGIYDFGQVDGMLYIIMELVKGESLYHLSYGKKVKAAECTRIVSDICEGLASAHSHGILHRDIKPANILLGPNLTPKIGDFGLARQVGAHESDSAFGTPGYTAPEVVQNPKAVDESTDLYALGVILYELLTGKIPDSAYTPAATIAQCDPAYDQIIRKAIHPTPAMRFRKAEDFLNALKKIPEPKAGPTLLTASKSKTTIPAASNKSAAAAPNKLVTASSAGKATPSSSKETPAPAVEVGAGSNVPFIRNIIIIIALLATIYITWEQVQKTKAKRADDQAQIDAEQKADQEEKEEARKLALQETKKKSQQTTKKTPAKTPKLNKVKPKKEGPQQSLARLRPQLVKGDLSELPKTAFTRNGRARMFIPLKMTWQDAQNYCEWHGGHLAVSPETLELQSLCEKLKHDQTIWLGAGSAGKNLWSWVDGSPWKLEIRNTSKAAYVAVDDTGILTPQPASNKNNFFIEWSMDGKKTAHIRKQLSRCADSLASDQPIYPPGTISYDNRHYLLVKKKTNWKNALRLAQQGGGILATASNPDENVWMLGFVGGVLKKHQGCWIGAHCLPTKSWQWENGEAWEFAQWRPNAPNVKPNTAAACAIHADQLWDDHAIGTQLPYFLIEWSKDSANSNKGATSANTVTAESNLSPLRKKCSNLISSIQSKYDKTFTKNIKGYEQELRYFLRGLPKTQNTAFAPGIQTMMASYPNNRIPTTIPLANMPKKVSEILSGRLEKQQIAELQMLTEIEKVRIPYRENLQKMHKDFEAKGLKSHSRGISQELKKTSGTTKDFVKHIMGTK